MEPSPEDVILEEEIDPSYEPTEEELVEYATWLGMDLTNHKNLLWIAKEALTAPLPNDWKPCLTEDDEIYYFNFTSGRSIWDHPCDEYYRKVYKEEVQKLKQSQQQGDNQADGNSNPMLRDQKNPERNIDTISAMETDRGDHSLSSLNSFERVSARDLIVDSKSSIMSCFPSDTPSTSQSNHLSRSLPPPHFIGHPALLNRKGGSFDSMIRLYAAQHGGRIPYADLFRMQDAAERFQLQTADNSLGTASGHTHMSRERSRMRALQQGNDKQELGKRVSQIKERIERKLVDEERVVLQQERVEMLERVCKQVQDEESHILDSLRREIMERMETNIRHETQALLAKRRKEIVEEVEREMLAEKLLLMQSYGGQQTIVSQERKSVEDDMRTSVSGEVVKLHESEACPSDPKTPKVSAERSEKQRPSKQKNVQDLQQEDAKQKNVQGSKNHGSSSSEKPRDETEAMHGHLKASQASVRRDDDDVVVREERRFEKSFHVQDSQTSVLLKLEVLMKIGNVE